MPTDPKFPEAMTALSSAGEALKRYMPKESDRDSLEQLMLVTYEFNRACNLTASRHEMGTAAEYCADVLSNIEQALIGKITFSPPVLPDTERDMEKAAVEILAAVRQVVAVAS